MQLIRQPCRQLREYDHSDHHENHYRNEGNCPLEYLCDWDIFRRHSFECVYNKPEGRSTGAYVLHHRAKYPKPDQIVLRDFTMGKKIGITIRRISRCPGIKKPGTKKPSRLKSE